MAILVNVHDRNKSKHLADRAIGPDLDHQLTINLPDGRVLRVIARSVLIAIVIMAIPWIESAIESSSEAANYGEWARPVAGDETPSLRALFQDLNDNGLLQFGAKALLLLTSEDPIPVFPSDYGIDVNLISPHDEEQRRSVPDDTFDFAYTVDFHRRVEFVDRALKVGGVAAIRLSPNPSQAFRLPPNFRIVYIRKFDETVVAIRKVSPSPSTATGFRSSSKRRLCARNAPLKGYEPLLEPPPYSSRRRITYLADLLGGSQSDNPRRVLIVAVGSESSGNNDG